MLEGAGPQGVMYEKCNLVILTDDKGEHTDAKQSD